MSIAQLEFSIFMFGMLLLRIVSYILIDQRPGRCSVGVVWFLWLMAMVPAAAIVLFLYMAGLLNPLFLSLIVLSTVEMVWQLCYSFKESRADRKSWIFLLLYVILILCITIVSRIGTECTCIYARPFADMLNDSEDHLMVFLHYILNVLLFLPIGFFCFRAGNRLQKNRIPAIAFGGLLSVVVESIQMVFSIGISDITDLFCNTAGAAAGAILASVWLHFLERGTRDESEDQRDYSML